MSKPGDPYEAVIREVIPPWRWKAILERLAVQAEGGDLAAVRLLLPMVRRRPDHPAGQLKLELFEEE